MVTTETTYVQDLSTVIEGYVMPLQMRTAILPYDNAQLESLFGNIIQIRDFHRFVKSTVCIDPAPPITNPLRIV